MNKYEKVYMRLERWVRFTEKYFKPEEHFYYATLLEAVKHMATPIRPRATMVCDNHIISGVCQCGATIYPDNAQCTKCNHYIDWGK